MKKNTFAIFALAALCSCNLDMAPENVMVDQTVYKEAKTCQASLFGAYNKLNVFLGGAPEDQNNYSYMSLCWMAGDVGTGNTVARPSGSTDFLALESGEYDNSVRDGSILTAWVKGYNTIGFANNVIEGINLYGEFDEALERQYTAEALFIRAFTYFNMLKMWGDGALTGRPDGLGLILRETPFDGYNPENIMTRSTNEQTWDFIINDLETALPDLPDNPGRAEDRFRATKPVVWALLSRVYLYKGSFTNDHDCMSKSVEYAGKVLACSEYVFSTAYNDHRSNIFPLNEYSDAAATEYPDPTARSSEIILYQPSRISTEKYVNGVSLYYYSKRVVSADSDFIASSYAPGDLRGYVPESPYTLVGIASTQYSATDLTSTKYTNSAGYDDVIYIRLSEIKLNLAEALARRDGSISDEALKQLNDIRCKPFEDAARPSALKASDFASVQAFIDEVLAERNRELAFESHYRWDLIRTGGKLRNPDLTDAAKVLPIPDYEVNISKGKIKQNSAFE